MQMYFFFFNFCQLRARKDWDGVIFTKKICEIDVFAVFLQHCCTFAMTIYFRFPHKTGCAKQFGGFFGFLYRDTKNL